MRVRSPSPSFAAISMRPRHPDGPRDVGGSGAETALLTAAENDGCEPNRRSSVADPQRTDTLRPIELVRRGGEEIDIEFGDIHRDLADGLGGVAVNESTARTGEFGRLGQRLDGARFIVREHQGHQDGVVTERVGELIEIDSTGAVDPDEGDLPTAFRQRRQGLEDRSVFGALADDVPAAVRQRFGGAHESDVVALGRTGGEHHFARRVSAEQPVHRGAGPLQFRGRIASGPVVAGRRVGIASRS